MKRTRTPVSPRTLSESAGRLSSILGAAAAVGLFAGLVRAQPQGGQVVAGSATITQSGSSTVITAAHNTIINFNSFNIPLGTSVQFIQPGSTSRVLNRITGADPSIIGGTLSANGIVYISNPAGVYFRSGAMVNVGGIFAGAGKITDADFLANVNRFTDMKGVVENRGTIRAGAGGAVALLGARAANFGTIVAPQGLVTLAAGSEVYISDSEKRVMAKVAPLGASEQGAGVVNAGTITATGGRVALGSGDMYAMAIDQRGQITARDVSLRGGRGGVVSVSGTIDASNQEPGGRGGTIEVLGDKVGIFGGTLDASGAAGGGTVLVGGALGGKGPQPNATATYVSEDARISADATVNGDGGAVIVWSDVVTRALGHISARGGAQGGNGGFIETSGKSDLVIGRAVDVTASHGRGGTWLLDPRNVTISQSVTTANMTGASPFSPTGAGAVLDFDDLLDVLIGGATIIVNTSAGGPDDGNITLTGPLDFNRLGLTNGTLRLDADNDIVIDGAISDSATGDGDLLNLEFNADVTAGGTTGVIRLNNNINVGAASITFLDAVVLGANVQLDAGAVAFQGTVDSDATARDLTINNAGTNVTTFAADVGGTDALDALTISAGGDMTLGFGITAASINVSTTGALAVGADLVGATSITLRSGSDGTGDLTLGAFNLDSATISLRAGDGAGGTTTAAIDLSAGPTFRSADGAAGPGALSLRQDAAITDAVALTSFQGGSVTGMAYALTSDDGALTIATAARVAGSALNLAGAGDVTVTPAISVASLGLTSSANVIVTGGATVAANGSFSASGVDFTSGGPITTSGTGGVTVNSTGNVVLGGTLASGTGDVSITGAAITQNAGSTITSTDVVTITGADAVSLGAGIVATNSLTVRSGTDGTGDLTLGAFNFDSASISLRAGDGVGGASAALVDLSAGPTFRNAAGTANPGTFSLRQDAAIADALALASFQGGSVTGMAYSLTSDDGAVTIATGARVAGSTLTLTGTSVNLNSAMSLAALTVNGPTTLSADVTTTGAQTYVNAAVLGADVTLTGGGLVRFQSTLNGAGNGTEFLHIAGAGGARFDGVVGGGVGTALQELTVAGATALNADVTTAGLQTYTGALTIGSAGTRSLIAGGAVTTGTVTLNTDANISGTVLSLGAVTGNTNDLTLTGGTSTALSTVTNVAALSSTAGTTTLSGNVTTTGAQTFGTLVLSGAGTRTLTSSGAGITTGALTLNTDAALSGAILDLGAVTGNANDLALTATTSTAFAGASALGDLTFSGAGAVTISGATTAATLTSTAPASTVVNGDVTTTGAQNYGALTIGGGGARTLQSSGAGISTGTVSLGTTANFTGTTLSLGAVTGAGNALTLTGSTSTSLAAVSGVTSLSSTAGTTTLNGNVTTTGSQTYGALALGGAGTRTLSGTDLTLGAVTGNGLNLTLAGTGTVTLDGAISGVAALDSTTALVTDIKADISTSGAQTYGVVSLGGTGVRTLTGTALSLGALTANGHDLTLNGTNLTLSTVTGGGHNLTLNGSGTTALNGAVSGVVALTTNAGGATEIHTASLDATSYSFGDNVLLFNDLTLTGTSAAFAGTVNSSGGAWDLTVNAATTLFAASVGNTGGLDALTTDAAGTTTLGTAGNASTFTVGSAAFGDAVLVAGTNTITTGLAGTVTFSGLVNSTGAPAGSLTVDAFSTLFGAAVGNSAALGSLTSSRAAAGGVTTQFNGSVVNAATVSLQNAVLLNNSVTFGGTTVTFGSTVNSLGIARALTVNATNTAFSNVVGNSLALASLTTDAAGTTTIGGTATSLNINGAASFGDDVVVGVNTTIGAGSVSIAGSLNNSGAPRTLTLNAPTIALAAVGDTSPLGTLITPAGSTATLTGPTLDAGTFQFGGNVVLGADIAALTGSTAVTFAGTLASQANQAFDILIDAPTVTFSGRVGEGTGALGNFAVSSVTNTVIATDLIRAGLVNFLGAVVLNTSTTVDAGATGSVDFSSTVNSATGLARNLTVNAATTTFGDTVGAVVGGALGSLTTDAAGTTTLTGNVTAGSAQFLDDVTLADNTTIAGSSLTFGKTVASAAGQAFDLVISSGTALFQGAVGAGPGALGAFTTDSATTATFAGGSITGAAVILAGDAVFNANTTITGSASVAFGGGIRSQAGAVRTLTVNSPSTLFAGGFGTGADLLGGLTTDAAGLTTISKTSIDAAVINFNDAVRFDTTASVNATSLRFGGAVTTLAGVSLTVNAAAAVDGGSVTTTGGDQTWNGALTLGADTTFAGNNLAFGGTVNSAGAARALTANSAGGGLTTFAGAVGNTLALASLNTNADGTTSLAAAVNAATVDIGDTLRLDGAVIVSGASARFRSTVSSASGAGNGLTVNATTTIFDAAIGGLAGGQLGSLVTDAAGTTTLSGGTVNAASANFNDALSLTTSTTFAGNTLRFGGAVSTTGGSTSLTVNSGTTTLAGASVTTSADQNWNGALVLGADASLTGTDITFAAAVDSDGTARSLGITNTGAATFTGRVGGTSALNALSVSGLARIGNSIDTAGGMTFQGAVRVFADSILTDSGGTGAAGGARFNSTIDSEGGPRALTILINNPSSFDPDFPDIPKIVLQGNVGATGALASLTLGANAGTVPPLATIVALQNTTITAGDFTMGIGQKFTVLGSLTLNLTGAARVGDISVLDDLSITAASIDMRNRASAAIFGPTTIDFITFTVTDAGIDHGVDLVAADTIFLSVAPTVSGGGFGTLSTAGALRITGASGGVLLQIFDGAIDLDSLRLKNSPVLVAFDLQSDGPTTTNVSSSIAGAIPRETQSGQVTADTIVSKADQEELATLGVFARPLEQGELADFLSGRAFYVDVPEKVAPQSADYKVAVNRLPSEIVAVVLTTYRELFARQAVDPVTGQVRRDPDAIATAIGAAWTEYAAAGNADPAGFRPFLAGSATHAEADAHMRTLARLFAQLEYLGLTPLELDLSRGQLCNALSGKGITREQLELALLEAPAIAGDAGASRGF